ncbi:uncharacterized protein [Vulpes vulpes]|uniref:Collagen alpha-1(I) chain-like n=1 Tax=Vulpes vulpes TaxID=9627 RepID=A0ABM4YCJ3_VULVU
MTSPAGTDTELRRARLGGASDRETGGLQDESPGVRGRAGGEHPRAGRQGCRGQGRPSLPPSLAAAPQRGPHARADRLPTCAAAAARRATPPRARRRPRRSSARAHASPGRGQQPPRLTPTSPRSPRREWAAGCRPRSCGGSRSGEEKLGDWLRPCGRAWGAPGARPWAGGCELRAASCGRAPRPERPRRWAPAPGRRDPRAALRAECAAARGGLTARAPGPGGWGRGRRRGSPPSAGGAGAGFPGPPGGGGGLSPLPPALTGACCSTRGAGAPGSGSGSGSGSGAQALRPPRWVGARASAAAERRLARGSGGCSAPPPPASPLRSSSSHLQSTDTNISPAGVPAQKILTPDHKRLPETGSNQMGPR